MSDTTSRGIQYPTSGDIVRTGVAGEAKLAQDLQVLATTTNTAINQAEQNAKWSKRAITQNEDLDDFQDDGFYWCTSQSIVGSLSNYPSQAPQQSFRLLTYALSSSLIQQEITVTLSGDIFQFERYRIGDTWHEWSEKSGPTKILSQGDSLGDETRTGTLLSPTYSVSNSLPDWPAEAPVQPARIETVKINNTILHQTLTVGQGGRLYRFLRYKLVNAWNAWINDSPKYDEVAPGQQDRTKVTVFGDSQVAGGPQTGGSMTGAMQVTLGNDTTVTNLGRSGDTVDRVNIRAQVYEMWFTIEGGQIPTAGSVSVITDQPIDTQRDTTFVGALAGVPGTLSYAASSQSWQFERSASGSAVSANGLHQFISSQSGHEGDTLVFWMGGNNTWDTANYITADISGHVKAAYQNVMRWVSRQQRVLLPGMTYGLASAEGSEERRNLADEVNDWLAQVYPASFCKINEWLIADGMDSAGLTDTQADIDARADGLMPPSLLADDVHFTPEATNAIGIYLGEQLRIRGWA